MYADSHCHLGDERFDEDRKAVLQQARDAGVESILNIATDERTLEVGLTLPVWNAAATTPHDVEDDVFFGVVQAQVGKLDAIGETGLDYFYEHSPRKLQQEFLEKYVGLAKEHDLPLIIHCREAFDDLFALLNYDRVILHCFTGTIEEAKSVIDRGWLLSLSGIVTFKKSEELREVAKMVPVDQLLIETDAPYLAPQSRRGKRNEPAFVVEVAEVVGKAKGLSGEEVGRKTAENLALLLRKR